MAVYIQLGDRIIEIPNADKKGERISGNRPAVEKYLAKTLGTPIAEVRKALEPGGAEEAPPREDEGELETIEEGD